MNNQQGFWALLLGADTYSTQRAKWFYEKAESIFNAAVKLFIIVGGVFLLFSFAMNPFAGLFQLVIDMVIIFFLVIFVIFNKLLFMAVGALIRIGEILESNSKAMVSTYKSPMQSAASNLTATSSSQYTKSTSVEKTKNESIVSESAEIQSTATKNDPERERFDQLRIEAMKKITSQGHGVTMQGEYPHNKWEINYNNGKTKRISNIEELIAASSEIDS